LPHLLEYTPKGLYCPAADVYIDPHRTVPRAVLTHAHSDHARRGHKYYLAHRSSEHLLRLRLGKSINLETVGYDEPVVMNGVRISLHPAGHVVGSAQIRVEHGGEVWVVSGDYKIEP
jgi:putative mRNA 3-end processing factor